MQALACAAAKQFACFHIDSAVINVSNAIVYIITYSICNIDTVALSNAYSRLVCLSSGLICCTQHLTCSSVGRREQMLCQLVSIFTVFCSLMQVTYHNYALANGRVVLHYYFCFASWRVCTIFACSYVDFDVVVLLLD